MQPLDRLGGQDPVLALTVAGAGLGAPGLVFSTTSTDAHLAAIVELIAPQGRLALIDDPERLDVSGNAALSGVPVTVSGR